MKKIISLGALVCSTVFAFAQTGVNNLSFEAWTSFGAPTPTGFVSTGATQMTTGAQHLNSYVRITSNGLMATNSSATGAMQLGGLVGITPVNGAPYVLKPFSLTGYYKCNLIGNDTVYIAADLTNNTISILSPSASKGIKISASTTTWTPFVINLTYSGSNVPDSLHIYAAANQSFAGESPGSFGTILDLDNFALHINATGIQQFEDYDQLATSYPNPSHENLTIITKIENAGRVEVYDLNGRLLVNKNFETQKAIVKVDNFTPGFYIYKILDAEGKILGTEKFIVTD